jgi:hypothetical protein
MTSRDFQIQATTLIDDIKSVCANYGLGNDGNEYRILIKDYNKDGGGKYAEYFTPHAVAKIMAACLVTKPVKNVTCYDLSAGSGTLLMALAHAIGEDRCSIFSQDISQKSSNLLRLNLILNNLVHSIPNIIQHIIHCLGPKGRAAIVVPTGFITRGETDLTAEGVKAASLTVLPAGSVLMSSRAPLFQQQDTLEQQSHHLAQLRDWLLPMLMNGQVRVTR